MSQSFPKYLSKLKGTRVLVIGGSSGIGFGAAEALLEHRASVVVCSSSPERVKCAVQRLRSQYQSTQAHANVQGCVCNLGSFGTLESEVEQLFASLAEGGKLDHVVFTAGDSLPIHKLEEFTLHQIQQAGLVRFFAPIVVAQHLRQQMRDCSASSFTLTTGGIPEHLMKDWGVVQGYLAGVSGLARGLAVDLAPIRVNAVGLGPVETELWDGAKEAGFYDQIATDFKAKMTTGTIGKVEDVVESYLYLMKDRNVSGSVVNSHGGTLLL